MTGQLAVGVAGGVALLGITTGSAIAAIRCELAARGVHGWRAAGAILAETWTAPSGSCGPAEAAEIAAGREA